MAVGNEVELDVLRMAHGGVAVAELEAPGEAGGRGRVVFVADSLPGERVLARITDETHDRFWRADALRVVVPSPDRRDHVWGAASIERDPAERAGGAELGHITPMRQRALKTEVLVDALTRIGRMSATDVAALEPEVRAVPGPADGTRTRTRLRLHVDRDGRVGPYAARSRRVVPVRDLPLAVEPLEALLPERASGRALELVAAGGDAFAVRSGQRRPPVTERVGERTFTLEALGFWQVHPAAADVLSAAVRDAVDPGAFDPGAGNLDLYGGVGLLAAALADLGGAGTAVTTVESDRLASGHAARNLADLPQARAVADRVDRYLLGRPGPLTGAVVVLDPPRSGAGAEVVSAIADARPEQVVYVACDPVALARDLRTFAERGWAPVRLRAFDLFPHTHHLEAVVALRRA